MLSSLTIIVNIKIKLLVMKRQAVRKFRQGGRVFAEAAPNSPAVLFAAPHSTRRPTFKAEIRRGIGGYSVRRPRSLFGS